VADLSHSFGSDLSISAMGDLAASSGTVLGQQRVLRRLLTNPGGYIWHNPYGAGLPRFVGQPAGAQRIGAVARTQMFQERAVARTPPPAIAVDVEPTGVVTLTISYFDAAAQETVAVPPFALAG
jgi:hypothetical protein